MTPTAAPRTVTAVRPPHKPFPLGRLIAWGSLLVLAGIIVRAEIQRPAIPDGVVAYTEIVYRVVDGRQAKLDVYVPRTPPPLGGRPTLLAIHGGGWRGGSKNGYGREIARFATHGYVVVAVGYQLSTDEIPSWPGNFEDVREAVRWVRRHAADYGIDPNRVAAIGASAGGHLATLLGTYPDGPVRAEGRPISERGPKLPLVDSARVQAVIDFYGPLDLADLANEHAAARGPIAMFLGGSRHEEPGRYAAASPIAHVSSDDPPVMLLYGNTDDMAPLEQPWRMGAALNGAGVSHQLIVLDGVGHGFGLRVGNRDLLPEILAFLSESWNHEGRPGARSPAE